MSLTLHLHYIFIIKFPYNARSDWLKQRASSENRARADDIKLAFKFLLRNFDKFDLNETSPVIVTNAMEKSSMSTANMAHEDHC